MRCRVLLCTAIVVVSLVVVPRSSRASAVCGDLNGDSRLTIADAVILLHAAAFPPGAPTLCAGGGALACGDMNHDGTVSVADVVILLNFLVGNPTLLGICQAPSDVSCPGPGGSGPAGESWTGQVTVHGNVTTSQSWPTGCRVNVDGMVFVQPGVAVNIRPGAIVAGVNPPSPPSQTIVSALVFLRGSKIIANGTPSQPILMQSSDHLDHGAGHIGDWGGLTINGAAPVNCPGGSCFADGLVGVVFGGSNPNDSSGVLRYVRVEFAGKEVAPDSTLRNITLNGVGRGTLYDHVQANVGFDDCQAWYGGTVNGKYLVSSGCGDDLFDMQLGTSGRFQYLLGVQYEPYLQNLGTHAIEWDNNENGFDLLPRSAPVVCNATLVGTNLQPSVGLGSTEAAATLRRGTAGRITNTIAMHFRSTGLDLRDNATANQACDPGPVLRPGGLLVDHALLFDDGTDTTGGPHFGNVQSNWNTMSAPPLTALANCTGTDYWNLLTAGGTISPAAINSTGSPGDPGAGLDPGLPVKYGLGLADSQTDLAQFVPTNSAAAGFPLVTSLASDCHAIDPYFDTTTSIGAFAPAQPSWLTSPWVSFELH